jgi:DNA primase
MIARDVSAVQAHYTKVVPMLVEVFGRIPIVVVAHDKVRRHLYYHDISALNVPSEIPTVQVKTTSGLHKYFALDAETVAWAVEHVGAIQIESWSPHASDPTKPRFARIILARRHDATLTMLSEAVMILAAFLRRHHCDPIVLNEGGYGAAVWFAVDCADYASLRAWLGELVSEVQEKHPGVFTLERPRSEQTERIALAIQTNAVGHFSALPLSVLDAERRFVATPIAAGTVIDPDIKLDSFKSWLEAHPNSLEPFSTSLVPKRSRLQPRRQGHRMPNHS